VPRGTLSLGILPPFPVSDEKIKWWQSVPATQKLEWLEEANNLLRNALSPEKRQIMEKFRRGGI
jgi:hypothetical protein